MITEECKLCYYHERQVCHGATEEEFLKHEKEWKAANRVFEDNSQSRFAAVSVSMPPTPCINHCSTYGGHEHRRDERDIENERRLIAYCNVCGDQLLWTANGGTVCAHCKFDAPFRGQKPSRLRDITLA